MLTFRFSGADGVMSVTEKLTSGMVGKQVKLEFTSDWDDLTKTAVFVAGDVSRAVVNVGTIVNIPAEVLEKPNQRLYVGIYGVDAEETLIIPTIMAKGPKIEKGAEPSDDPSTDPQLPVWAQLEDRIKALENEDPSEDAEDGGYYTPAVSQVDESTMEVSFAPSKEGMAEVAKQTITLPSGRNGADGVGIVSIKISEV